jgi:hypothetical protein
MSAKGQPRGGKRSFTLRICATPGCHRVADSYELCRSCRNTANRRERERLNNVSPTDGA